jgi:hypothetical protein
MLPVADQLQVSAPVLLEGPWSVVPTTTVELDDKSVADQ